MTQQPFDPMDKLLREALASDALPPSALTDRIMAQVERTPQGGSAASSRRRSGSVCASRKSAKRSGSRQSAQETKNSLELLMCLWDCFWCYLDISDIFR